MRRLGRSKFPIRMWGSSITREELQHSLLAVLESVRDRPKQHILVSPPDWRSSLTKDQEREIISNLASFPLVLRTLKGWSQLESKSVMMVKEWSFAWLLKAVIRRYRTPRKN